MTQLQQSGWFHKEVQAGYMIYLLLLLKNPCNMFWNEEAATFIGVELLTVKTLSQGTDYDEQTNHCTLCLKGNQHCGVFQRGWRSKKI